MSTLNKTNNTKENDIENASWYCRIKNKIWGLIQSETNGIMKNASVWHLMTKIILKALMAVKLGSLLFILIIVCIIDIEVSLLISVNKDKKIIGFIFEC